jgi:hypothetical protein
MLYEVAPVTADQEIVFCALPATADTPAGAAGGALAGVSTWKKLVEEAVPPAVATDTGPEVALAGTVAVS